MPVSVMAWNLVYGLSRKWLAPDSELYRRHPDWILHHDPAPRLLARHQLVLDLTRPEVDAYLFESISGLLERQRLSAT